MDTNTQAANQTVEKVLSLYREGQYVDAYAASQELGPLQEWKDPAAQLVGGRLAHVLGCHRLGRVMHRAAYRGNPKDPETIYFYVLSMLGRRGLLESWECTKEFSHIDSADVGIKERADWLALKSRILGALRDFEMAEQLADAAVELQPERAWLHVCKSGLLEFQDKTDEALECARHAHQLQPWYRPAVSNLAHMLVQQNLDEEALELMREGNVRLQYGGLRTQLAALCLELERYEEAGELYDSLETYLPLQHLDKTGEQWHAARLADVAYYLGKFDQVAAHAEKADTDFYKTLAKNVAEKTGGKRVILPVRFVRQNHLTCAPATLTAISEFWDKPAEHLEVVEEICYDGTPAHNERRWAESNGYVAREFRVTLESTTALIDRGLPFTLTTVAPGSAHLQAVIGYDTYRESIVIRDPGERHFTEFETAEMLKYSAPDGPRGMVMVPKEKAELLDGVELPEVELYDLFFKVELALETHNRDEAIAVVGQMRALEDEHRLTLRARGNIATYDGNARELLALSELKLSQFPDHVNTQLAKLACLADLGMQDERLEMLEGLIEKKDCDPMFWSQYAGELANDAREHEKATRYLHKAMRYRSHDVRAYAMMATILMDQEKQSEALELFRFAACIGDMSEGPARSYFSAARVTNQTSTVLRFLKDRFRRFSKKSSYPTRTLCAALDHLDRTSDAFKVLEQGYKHRPDDGEFLLYYSDFCGRYGKLDRAKELLADAKGKCHETQWLRTAALQHTYRGESSESLALWKQVIDKDPLDVGAHRMAADMLADTEGDEAAIDFLRKSVERFGHSYGLRMLLIEWLRGEHLVEFESQLQRFIELNPADAWGLRELAFLKLSERKFDEATRLIQQAQEIEPNNPAASYVLGRAAINENKTEAAKEHFKDSLRLTIDYEPAILSLIACCESKSERVAALEFVYQELESQVSFGDGLLTFRNNAVQTLDAESLLTRLKSALRKRPDLWQGWSAMVYQLSDMQRHEEAIKYAKKATKKFPLLPRTWIDLSLAHASCGEIDGEIAALKRAMEINQSWSEPARLLAEAYEKKGDLDLARAEIERTIVSDPRDVRNLGFLASLMWRQGEKQQAVDTLVKAVKMQPAYSWGWSALDSWAAELNQKDLVIEIAQDLTKTRPRHYKSWLTYAQTLGERDQIDEAVAALDQAIALNPSNLDAYNQKALQLTRAGRFDEALAATRPAALAERGPLELKSRAAWIEAERGNLDTAVTMMERIVKTDPDYHWAWTRLAEWYEFQDKESQYHAAAKQMVRLAPQDAVSWGYLGDAELRKKNKVAAKKHFLQAVQLSPAYNFASSRLVDLQLDSKEYDEALATVDLVAPHLTPAWVLSEKVRINCLREDRDAALGYLKELALTPADDSTAIDGAVESLFHAKWGKDVLPVLDGLLDEEQAQVGVAYVFVHLSSTLKEWDSCIRRMDSIVDRPALWKEGARKLVIEMATGDQHPRMHKFIKKHRQVLFEDVELWDAVGEAYNSAELYKKTLGWMQDWRSREGVTMAMAHTVSVAHWELKQPHKGVEVSRHAMQRFEPDGTVSVHLTVIAFHELIYGSVEASVDAVSMVDPSQLGGLYNLMFQYIVGVLENLSQGGSYKQLADHLQGIWASLPPGVQQISFVAWIHALCDWRSAVLHKKRFKAMMLKRKT